MKTVPSTDKLRGGYYTPQAIARFLARWAVRSASDHVLEPSCGDGAIVTAVARRMRDLSASQRASGGAIVGVELHSDEAAKAHRRAKAELPADTSLKILEGDFFSHAESWGVGEPLFARGCAFDAVVGNPPFIRYQNFPEQQRLPAFRIMKQHGLCPNRLTNAWVPFLVTSTVLLKEGGRLAMVIPSELLQVSYAAEVRQFLASFFGQVSLVTFRKLLFTSVQQDVVLLLAERTYTRSTAIRVLELDSLDCLSDEESWLGRATRKKLDHSTEKWTRYFLSARQISFLRALEKDSRITNLSHYAEVDVGVVTGENSFFALTEDDAQRFGLSKYVAPLVSRSAQVPGLVLSRAHWLKVRANQDRVLLFVPPDDDPDALPSEVVAYIRHGEHRGVHNGYKCRIRKRWYIVPSRWVPDAFGLRQVHDYPRLVLNGAGATATDTLHRVRFKNGQRRELVSAAMVNSLTLAFSEVIGRSYGGGVLTFEPSEFERLPLPMLGADRLDFSMVDRLTREGRISEALTENDQLLLRDGLGFDAKEIRLLRSAWDTLRERRHGRTRAKRVTRYRHS